MPKVKMTASYSGARGVWSRGSEVEMSDVEAERMVAAGHAEPVDPPKKATAKKATAKKATAKKATAKKAPRETADVKPAETTEGS